MLVLHSQRDDEIRFYENILTSKFSIQGLDNDKIVADYNKLATTYSDLIFFTTQESEKRMDKMMTDMQEFRRTLGKRQFKTERTDRRVDIPVNAPIDLKELLSNG